jgi:hypothetical protein
MPTYIPEHIVNCFEEVFSGRMSDHHFAARQLRPTDPPLSLGVVVMSWEHLPTSAQIGQVEPGMGRYSVRVQNMVKHLNEESGREIHNAQCALVRAVLYRSEELRLRLVGVDEEIEGSAERVKRLSVRRQDFLSNQISGSFLYLCASEVHIETEITLL